MSQIVRKNYVVFLDLFLSLQIVGENMLYLLYPSIWEGIRKAPLNSNPPPWLRQMTGATTEVCSATAAASSAATCADRTASRGAASGSGDRQPCTVATSLAPWLVKKWGG